MTTGQHPCIIGTRYKVIKLLGEGGFSKTYLAEDLSRFGNQCAVKHFTFSSHQPNEMAKARELFQREAEILKKLNGQPQIPQLFDYFEENQQLYLVQEFIDGHSLCEEIERRVQLEEKDVINLLIDLLKILEFVHNKNIIHRDINPNNIIRRQQDGKLVLIDFGAVKEVVSFISTSNLKQPGTKIYTLGYAPPEQMHGYPEFSSDIYALGMTAIQALTGLAPQNLPLDSRGEIFWQDKARVSDRLASILSKMVCFNIKVRYQSVKEVLFDLHNTQGLSTKTLLLAPIANRNHENYVDFYLGVLLLILIVMTILYSAGLLPEKKEMEPKKSQLFSLVLFDKK